MIDFVGVQLNILNREHSFNQHECWVRQLNNWINFKYFNSNEKHKFVTSSMTSFYFIIKYKTTYVIKIKQCFSFSIHTHTHTHTISLGFLQSHLFPQLVLIYVFFLYNNNMKTTVELDVYLQMIILYQCRYAPKILLSHTDYKFYSIHKKKKRFFIK